MVEKWMPIAKFPGYEVSNLGRVKSFKYRNSKILMQHRGKERYLSVTLCEGGEPKTLRVHRLVLLAFVGEPVSGYVADHINTITSDNRLENLRWVSQTENMRNPITKKNLSKNCGKYLLGKFGEKHPMSKAVIRLEDKKIFGSIREAGRSVKINPSCIVRVCLGKQKTAAGCRWEYVKEERKYHV